MPEKYEYVGFEFWVTYFDNKKFKLTPVEGQHPAAFKDKHRRSAIECFIRDYPGYEFTK